MSIVVKGIKQGVLANLSDSSQAWEGMLAELEAYIAKQGAFFKGAQWVVDVGERQLNQTQIVELQSLLAARDVELLALLSADEQTLIAAQAVDLLTELSAIPLPPPRSSPNGDEAPADALDEEEQRIQAEMAALEETQENEYVVPPMDSEVYGTGGVLIRQTLRSGRTVRSTGHVVIIGDVNSGAEVIATGDIIVWGKVRGVLHAGAQGDEQAVVCALDLAPTQLRIAALITVPPQDKRRVPRPEMARVNNGQIEAIPWG